MGYQKDMSLIKKFKKLLNISGSKIEQLDDSNKPKDGEVSDSQNSSFFVPETLEINVSDEILIKEKLS